ncbi:Uncharacterised protein [Mycobacteroides abscessus subsp. abscessus]|nr:Uncharacterised protein [Mycobacteroides abscessus subsp. abscessus]
MPAKGVFLGRHACGAQHRTIQPQQLGDDCRVARIDAVGQSGPVGAWGEQPKHAGSQKVCRCLMARDGNH